MTAFLRKNFHGFCVLDVLRQTIKTVLSPGVPQAVRAKMRAQGFKRVF